MNKYFLFLLFLLLFSLAPFFVETSLGQPPPPKPVPIPIDGGLGVLLLAGVGYAAKKLHGSKKEAK